MPSLPPGIFAPWASISHTHTLLQTLHPHCTASDSFYFLAMQTFDSSP